MKSIVQGSSNKECKNMWLLFTEWVKKNGHAFKQAKLEKKFQVNHGIEKTKSKIDQIEI